MSGGHHQSDLRCGVCGCASSQVIDSRGNSKGRFIRRRRRCLECGDRVTTYEVPEHPAMAADRCARALDQIAAIIATLGLPPETLASLPDGSPESNGSD